jgi:pyroglutamyl-peptidase
VDPIIVTGFEPFAGRRRNRSLDTLRALPARPGLERKELPVAFAPLREAIEAVLARRPSVLLLLGEAPGRSLRVEQVALNVADSELPDNLGVRPADAALVPGAPLALRVPWDAGAVAGRIRDAGVRARPSFHAGTYACNAALFHALHGARQALNAAPPGTIVGFLHVPRRGWPWGPPLRRAVRAAEIALEALVAGRT